MKQENLEGLIEMAEALIDMGDKDSPRVKLVKDCLWQVNYYKDHLKENVEKLTYLTNSTVLK
mgnify:FL=1